MAPPIKIREVVPPAFREDTKKRIESAQLDHADAVIAAYGLLQKLDDSGTLDLLRGAAGARDALMNQLVGALDTPEAITALRNLIAMLKALSNIDPDSLRVTIEGIAQTSTGENLRESTSLWDLSRRLRTKDARLGLAVTVQLLEAVGRAVREKH
jgi:uncharacterized protein YjgD (DUF1641 family)